MAWMNQERKAKISTLLKPVLKRYGVKGTLSVRNGMTIVLTLKSGKIDFIENYMDTARAADLQVRQYQYMDVNPYWYGEHFSGVAREFLNEAFDALKGADWYNNSDASVDYFDVAYYMDVNIGRWNKPYVVTEG